MFLVAPGMILRAYPFTEKKKLCKNCFPYYSMYTLDFPHLVFKINKCDILILIFFRMLTAKQILILLVIVTSALAAASASDRGS